MNIHSIRFHLTLWYSLAFFVSTAVVFVVFYFITKQSILYYTDRGISAHVETLIQILLNDRPNVVSGIFNQGIISQQFSEMPGMLVVITDAESQIIASSQTGAESNQIIQALLDRYVHIQAPVFVERNIGSTTLRIGIFPVIQNDVTTGLVLMGDPVDVIYRSLHSLLTTLILVYLVFLLPTIWGSYLLAKRAMEPINQISTELKTISSQNLNRKVKVQRNSSEIYQLATSFNSLLGRLHEAFIRERQFIGDIAHELKTPLATLRGEIEVALSKTRTNREYKKTLREILIDVERLSATIKNILDLAWIGAEKENMHTHRFNISKTIDELGEITHTLSNLKRITLKEDIEQGIYVRGAEDKVSRAILNIIDNAITYTPDGGSVNISLHKDNQSALIEVTDTGVGIQTKELPHIFERFYRGSKAAKTSGSGLGLAIAQGIIRAHGGDILVSSTIGKGTSVIIKLPIFT